MYCNRSTSLKILLCCACILFHCTQGDAQAFSTHALLSVDFKPLLISALFIIGFFLYFKRDSFFKSPLSSQLVRDEKESAMNTISDKEIQSSLKDVGNSKTEFISNISNELKTHQLVSESLFENNEDSEEEGLLYRKALKNGDQALANSILTLRKLSSGKSKIDERSLDLFDFTSRVFSSFEPLAKKSHIQYSYDYQASKDLVLRMDVDKLDLILKNLINIAMKYTPQDGNVTVRVEDLFNSLIISVKNSGSGISEKDLPYVFNRFAQAVSVEAKELSGTDIDLAIVEACTKLIEGEVSVESVINEGTVFTLRLKRKEILTSQGFNAKEKATLGTIEEFNNQNHNDSSTSKFQNTILIVEDNYSIRDFLRILLEDDFNIVSTKHGQEAIDYLATKDDLDHIVILCDIMMPVMDGYRLVEIIKGDKRFKKIPIIILTAMGDSESKFKILRLGANDYLLKPFDKKELKIKIQNLFKNQYN